MMKSGYWTRLGEKPAQRSTNLRRRTEMRTWIKCTLKIPLKSRAATCELMNLISIIIFGLLTVCSTSSDSNFVAVSCSTRAGLPLILLCRWLLEFVQHLSLENSPVWALGKHKLPEVEFALHFFCILLEPVPSDF